MSTTLSVSKTLEALDAYAPKLSQANPEVLPAGAKYFQEYRSWLKERVEIGQGDMRAMSFQQFVNPRLESRYKRLPGITPSEMHQYGGKSQEELQWRAETGGPAAAILAIQNWGDIAGVTNQVDKHFASFVREKYPSEIAAQQQADAEYESAANSRASGRGDGTLGGWVAKNSRWGAALAGAALGFAQGGIVGAIIGFLVGMMAGNFITAKFGDNIKDGINSITGMFSPKKAVTPQRAQAKETGAPNAAAPAAHTTITSDMVKNMVADTDKDGIITAQELAQRLQTNRSGAGTLVVPDPMGAEQLAGEIIRATGSTQLDAAALDKLQKMIETNDPKLTPILEPRSATANSLKQLFELAPAATPTTTGGPGGRTTP